MAVTTPDFVSRLTGWTRRPRATTAVKVEVGLGVQIVTWCLVGVAGFGAWFVVFSLGLSTLQEHHSQHNLYTSFRYQLSQGTAPLGGTIPRGSPVALLQSSAGGLNDLVVVEGTTSKQLQSGPGHLPGSPLPGQPGVSTIMGRGASFGAPLRGITGFHKGDAIKVTTGQGAFTYIVQDVRGSGDPVPAAPSGSQGQLVLITSSGSGWLSRLAPNHTMFVDASLKGSSQPAPPATAIASGADQIMRGGSVNIPTLILWIQLLVIGVVALVFGFRLRGRWSTWLIAVPILLTALWGTSSTVWQLLPNLL